MKRVIELKLVEKAFKQPKPDAKGSPFFDDAGELVTMDVDLSYADKLRELVKSGLPEGARISVAEMIELQEVWQAIKDAKDGEPLIMEQAAHKMLKKHLERLAWNGFHPAIAELLYAVMEAPEWKPQEDGESPTEEA